MVMPGDNVEMMCELYNPIALENGQRFNVREGGRTVSYPSNVFFWKATGIARHDSKVSYS